MFASHIVSLSLTVALGYLHGGEGAGQEAAMDQLCVLSQATTEDQVMVSIAVGRKRD